MRRIQAWSMGCSTPVLAVAGCGAPSTGTEVRLAEPPAPGAAYSLYTHCGIDVVRYHGRWYERVGGLLDDGQGNPPAGWDNPTQQGTLTRDGVRLVFQDAAGHHELFRPRPATAGPPPACS